MVFSIKLTDEEEKLVKSYAKRHSLSLDEAFKQALFKKIEDEYDIAIADKAYKDYLNNGSKSTPIKDFWEELELEEKV